MERSAYAITDIEKAKFRYLFCLVKSDYLSNRQIPEYNGDRQDFLIKYMKATQFKKENKLHDALHILFELMEDNPFFEHGYKEIGVIYGILGIDELHAIEYLEFSSVLLDSKDIPTLLENMYYSALIKQNIDKYDEALKEAELINTFPFFDKIPYADNVCFIGFKSSLFKLDVKGMEKWTKKIIELGKENSTILLLIGQYYWSIHMFDEAKKAYEKALKLVEIGKTYTPWRDVIYERQFNSRLNSEKCAILDGLASYYYVFGDIDRSLEFHYKALEISPINSASHFGLSSIFALKGEGDKMKDHLSKFIEFFEPGNPTHQVLIGNLLISDAYKSKHLRDEMLEMLVDKNIIHRFVYRQAKKVTFTGSEKELQEIKDMVGKGELNQAFESMLNKIPYNANQDLVHLYGRYSSNESENNKGVLRREEYEVSLSKISRELLRIIDNELKKVEL